MTFYGFFKELLGDFLKTYFTVLKLIVPVILILKLISYTPLISWLGILLAPIMKILGLPGDAGIVVATTLSTSIYAGMISWTALPHLQVHKPLR